MADRARKFLKLESGVSIPQAIADKAIDWIANQAPLLLSLGGSGVMSCGPRMHPHHCANASRAGFKPRGRACRLQQSSNSPVTFFLNFRAVFLGLTYLCRGGGLGIAVCFRAFNPENVKLELDFRRDLRRIVKHREDCG
jgi:hypothetical protein